MGEASNEGGLLIEGSESDGYEGLGQVPLRILPPSNSQSPQGRKLVIRDEGVAMQNEDGEKEEDWGRKQMCLGKKAVWQGSANSWVSQLWDTKS